MTQVDTASARRSLVSRVLSEWKILFVLGGPIAVAQIAQMANGVIDTIMSGHYSARDLAGVGIGNSLWVPLFLLFSGMLAALQPIVSGYRGAAQYPRIMPSIWQGIYIAMAASVIMIFLLTNVHPLLELLRLDAETARITQGYLSAFAWGIPPILFTLTMRGLTDGLGHTRVIMVFSLLNTLINLPLNYILIYGKFGLPELGGVGCGWATAIANWGAAIALMIYLNRSKTFRRFHLLSEWVKPRWEDIRYVLKLGIPIGFTMFIEVSMFSIIALFLAPLGPEVVAGHQIVLNITSLTFMIPLSLGMALTLRVSYLVGADVLDKARLVARSSLLLALGLSSISAPLLFFGRDMIAALYTSDSGVQAVAIHLLMFAAIFQVADVIQVSAINALRGYRDTRIPMLIMLVSFWGVCLPLGYVLTFTDWLGHKAGAAGFWIALIVGLTCASILLTYRLFRFRLSAQTRAAMG